MLALNGFTGRTGVPTFHPCDIGATLLSRLNCTRLTSPRRFRFESSESPTPLPTGSASPTAYVSPDVLSGKPYHWKPSDMWALGGCSSPTLPSVWLNTRSSPVRSASSSCGAIAWTKVAPVSPGSAAQQSSTTLKRYPAIWTNRRRTNRRR